ncbi:MAG TPA: 6-phosphogluconolactonase [Thermoanaerobaculia bacterium]|nr:6-phosphogluconolactonase [Thermoanaerobaculia bacterium]
MVPGRSIEVLADKAAITRAAAAVVSARAASAVAARGAFTLALSGGSTPKDLYRLLADPNEPFRARLPWDKTHFFFGDERHVPPDHADSNYRMAREAMLDSVPVPSANVHRVLAENPDAGAAAVQYEETLRAFFPPASGEPPRFDLILLGLGPEGHTASLFPGSPALHETERWVLAPWVEKFATHRITFTPPVLNRAAAVLFLVAGEDKAEAAQAVLDENGDVDLYPARVVRPLEGDLLWLLDRAAAKDLSANV